MPLTQVQPGMLGTPQPYNFKNRIINGAMTISQAQAGASTTALDSYPVDRFKYEASQTTKLTWQQNAGSVTPPAGFTNYLGATSSSAYSITSSDFFVVTQRIEGFNIADLGWGTANAKSVTLSFWVRSSLTGTFGGVFSNNAGNRSYPFTYTISAANTWEYETITIAGDTSGTWLTNNGSGITLRFGLGVGSTFSGTAGAWAATNYASATGATSVVGTSGATFYITGVQLEVGVTATGFDYRPYGTELALCQRYCYAVKDDGDTNTAFGTGQCFGTTTAGASIIFPVTMRASPSSLTTVGTFNVLSSSGAAVATTVLSINGISNPTLGFVNVTTAGLLTGGNATVLYASSSTAQLIFNAEL
jgi:hypothetical protein